jgi:hypothetical protein
VTDSRSFHDNSICSLCLSSAALRTGHSQKNGAVSKVSEKFISHPIRAQHTLLAAGTVQYLMRYQQFAYHAIYGAARPVSKMASQQEKAFCVLRFEVSRSVGTVQREFRARLKKDAPHNRNVFSCPNLGCIG